jgi:hypothetical protein
MGARWRAARVGMLAFGMLVLSGGGAVALSRDAAARPSGLPASTITKLAANDGVFADFSARVTGAVPLGTRGVTEGDQRFTASALRPLRLALADFGGVIAAAASAVPDLSGVSIHRWLSDRSATVSLPGSRRSLLLVSSSPLRASTGSGSAHALDLRLHAQSGSFAPGNPLVPVSLPGSMAGSFGVGRSSVTVSVVGGAAASAADLLPGRRTVFYANAAGSRSAVDVLAEAGEEGLDAFLQVRKPSAAVRLRFSTPGGVRLLSRGDGTVTAMSAGRDVATIRTRWALDAAGAPVRVGLTVASRSTVRVDLPAGISRHDLPILVAAAIDPASAGSRISRATAGWAYANVVPGLAPDVLPLAGSHSDGGFPLSPSVDRRSAATRGVSHSLWYYRPPGGSDSYINKAQFLGTFDANNSGSSGSSLMLGLYDVTGNMLAGDSLTTPGAAHRVTLAPSTARSRTRSGQPARVAAITLKRVNPAEPPAGFGYVGTVLLYLGSRERPTIVSVRPTELPLKVNAGSLAQVTVTAESTGLGIKQIQLIDARGRRLAQSTIQCAATNDDPCPASATRTLRVDWGTLAAGQHKLRLVAFDPAGNASVALRWNVTIVRSRRVGTALGNGQHAHLGPSCTDTWTNGSGDGNWATAANWSTGVVPSDSDYACVPAGDQVTVNSGTNDVGQLDDEGTLALSGGALSINNTSASSAIGTLNQTGGTLTGAAGLDVSGSWSWTGGAQSGSGSTVIDSGATATVNVGTGGRVWLDTRTLVNQGTMTLSSGSIQGSNAGTIENENTFYLNSEDTSWGSPLNWYSGAAPQLINAAAGLVEKSSGAGASQIGFSVDDSGTLNALSGQLSFPNSGASSTLENGSALLGTIAINGGSVSVGSVQAQSAIVDLQNGYLTMTGAAGTIGTFNQTSGTVNGSGELDVSGSWSWTGGTQSGSGSTVIDSGASATVDVGPGGRVWLDTRTLVNQGTMTLGSGSIQGSNAGTIENQNTFYLNSEDTSWGSPLNWYSGAVPRLINRAAGLVKKASGGGASQIGFSLDNYGTLNAATGQLSFPNSATSSTLEDASTLLGTIVFSGASVSVGSVQAQAATVDLQNGTLTMNGAGAATIQTLNQTGGTVAGAGELDVPGSWTWSGGTQSGAGTTVVDSGASATVNVGSGGRVWLDTRTLSNQGSFTLQSGSIQGSNGGAIENQNDFYLNSEDTSWGSPLNWYSGTPPWLINAPTGLVEKSNGTGTSPIGFWFENQGTTDGMSGTLSIPSGAWATSWNGTTLRGTIAINGGTFSVGSVQAQNATVDLQSGTLNMSAGTGNVGTFNETDGTVNGPGELDVCGSLNLAAGTMSGMGATVICQGAQASLGGGGQVTLNQRSLVNHGTLTWEGGSVQAENGSVLWNANQFVANAENTSFSAYGEAMLYNTGSISKIAGTGQTEFDPLFFNQGSAPSATTGQIIFRGLNADSYDGDDDTADTQDADASADGSQTGVPGTCSQAAATLVQDYIYLASGATEVVAGQAGVECPAGSVAASTGSTIYEQNPSGGGNLALANSGNACSDAAACIDTLGAVLAPGAAGYVDPTTPETFEGVADFEYSGGTSGPTEIDVAYPPTGLTQRVLNLANALETQNPGTIDDNNKLELAQQCLDLEDAATGNTDTSGDSGDVSFTNCKGLPIFVSGADVREATNHDLAALGWPIDDPWMGNQAVNPGWVMLSYRPASQNPSYPGWKNNLWPCTQKQPGQNCDEFPFYATQQGGGQADPLPNLEPIDGPQNQQQGSFYSAFLSNCGILSGSTPPQFLVVPVLPQSSIPTLTNVCNGW